MTQTDRIDTHQHYVPPRYGQWLASQGIRPGGVELPHWSKEAALNWRLVWFSTIRVFVSPDLGQGAGSVWMDCCRPSRLWSASGKLWSSVLLGVETSSAWTAFCRSLRAWSTSAAD